MMGEVLFCSQKLAKNPYFIQNISTNIYSIEELCYYLCKNLYLIDQNIKSETLCQWIEQEIGMKKLAGKLRQLVLGYGTDSMFVGYILRSIHYCEEEKIKEIEEILEDLNNKSNHEKRKARADRLFENGKYRKALLEYKRILKEPKEMDRSKEFYGNIQHNMGAVYGNLFLYREAIECLKKAYEITKDEKTLEEMAWCLNFLETQEEVDSVEDKQLKNLMSSIRTQKQELEIELKNSEPYLQLQNVKELGQQGEIEKYEEIVSGVLEKWKNEYRKNTD